MGMVIAVGNYFRSAYPFLLFDGNEIGLRVEPWRRQYRPRTISPSQSCNRCTFQVARTREIKRYRVYRLGITLFMLKFPLLSRIIHF